MTVIGHVVAALGVLALLLVLAAGATVILAIRRTRRRLNTLRARFVGAVGKGTDRRGPHDGRGRPRRPGPVASTTVASPGWWTVQGRRHRLWRAVTSAEHAIGIAERSGAAIGDLPHLMRRLRAAADAVDAVLRASGRLGRLSAQDRQDAERIVAAATELREAALSALRAGSHVDTETVISAVRIEVAAVAAGVRAAHR